MIVADGVRYLVSGSKNTCHIWPAKECFHEWMPKMIPGETFPAEKNAGKPHIAVGRAYSKWFRALDVKKQDAFVDALWNRRGGHCTLVGEVNRPWEEHILAIAGKQVGQTLRISSWLDIACMPKNEPYRPKFEDPHKNLITLTVFIAHALIILRK